MYIYICIYIYYLVYIMLKPNPDHIQLQDALTSGHWNISCCSRLIWLSRYQQPPLASLRKELLAGDSDSLKPSTFSTCTTHSPEPLWQLRCLHGCLTRGDCGSWKQASIATEVINLQPHTGSKKRASNLHVIALSSYLSEDAACVPRYPTHVRDCTSLPPGHLRSMLIALVLGLLPSGRLRHIATSHRNCCVYGYILQV